MIRLFITGVLLIFLLGSSCAADRGFGDHLNSIVEPYLFNFGWWESRAIAHEINQWLCGKREKIDDEIGVVTDYFSSTKRIKTIKQEIEAANAGNRESDLASIKAELNGLEEQRAALKETVERIIERQIRNTLAEQGIFNPIVEVKIGFPPINFKLEKPPYLLVISPRDRIESIREITLKPGLTLEERQEIEGRVDELDVSSLVVGLGGLGATYPTFVTDDASLKFTLHTSAEEWLHQYLVFKPLGFLYLLDLAGLARNYEIATMNETLAGIVSEEIGSMVYGKYYSEYENSAEPEQETEPEFDFDGEMRAIRKAVDAYLARGEIEQAEEFMEQKRQYLASMGYYIRKLNQAYFAFHGTYADKPAFISPIGIELKELRAQSASLKGFLDTVAAMTSRQDLKESIK
ncbi:hypothetical protein ACFLXO_07385 [Chloroflexota bacterium]